MKHFNSQFGTVSVRLASTPEEVEQAQRVRYGVFYEEYGATPTQAMQKTRLDVDHFDAYADHLIVIDARDGREKIVGTYRLLTSVAAARAGGFYSSAEFDITPLTGSDLSLLELGRSCVLSDFRARPVLQMLWQGIADYITERKIDLMFGCASLHGRDVSALAAPLSYMHHYHLSSADPRPSALPSRYVDMNLMGKADLDAKRVFAALPPILKGYFRLGGTIGEGAVVDQLFNTVDVLVMVETQSLTARYRQHYERKIQRSMGKPVETDAE